MDGPIDTSKAVEALPLVIPMPRVDSAPAPRPSPEIVEEQLRQVKARLVARYCSEGGLAEESVQQQFAEAMEGFADARIRTYLPVLVEHAVRARLSTATH